jgi:hypothetical protein
MLHDVTQPAGPDSAPAQRQLRPFVFLAFGSTREALGAEEVLLDAGLAARPVPLPRHRGSLCGIALRLPPEQEHAARSALAEHGIAVAARDELDDF